jgi:antigen flippase
MRSIFRATAILGSVSVVNILCGLVSAKVSALILGPVGTGYMGLLQGLLGLAAMIAGMGIGVGLIRNGAKALAQDEPRQVAALRRGAWLLCGALGGLAFAAMIVLREPISRFMLGGPGHGGAVIAVGFALLLVLAGGIQNSILNAHHRVGDLARIGLWTSIVSVGLNVLLIWRLGAGGIVPALVASSAVAWAVSFYYLRAKLPGGRNDADRAEVSAAARALLRFGVPYTGSMMVGAGLLMILPVLVVHELGPAEVGFYRAASAISINYLGFLLTAMAQDYYPRISATQDDPQALGRLVNDQLRLVLLIGGPIILGMLALVPYMLPLVYSSKFAPAGELLEWQLIGDLFKFSSWTMSFVIMARAGSSVYFRIELFGGSTLLLCSWLGIHWLGLAGLGLAFALCSASYCAVCWFVLRRDFGLRWTAQNKFLFLIFAAAMLIVRVLPWLGHVELRLPVALALAAMLGAMSAYAIWREIGGWPGLRAWRSPA